MSRPRRALILLGVWLVGGLAALPFGVSASRTSETQSASPAPKQEQRAPDTPPARPVSKQERLAPGTPSASPAPQQELRAPGTLAPRPVQKQELRAPGTPPASPAPPQKLRAEPVRPAPQTIREKWGIRVFLAWLWFTTGILLYLLRRLVRESDRVHGLGYATPEPTPPKKSEPRF